MKTKIRNLLPVLLAILILSSLMVCAAAQAASDTPEAAPADAAVTAEETVPALDEEEYVPLPLGSVPYVDNDTAERGEYTAFAPKEDADTFSGIAIEGNEEEELQQERIAGGAVGEATSVLEPLHGVTDYSEGEYVPVYGID